MRRPRADLSVLQQGWVSPLRIHGTPIRASSRVRTKRQAAQPDAINAAAKLNSDIMTENNNAWAPLVLRMARSEHPDGREWGLDDQLEQAERDPRTNPRAPGLVPAASRAQPEEHNPQRTTVFGFGMWRRGHKVVPALTPLPVPESWEGARQHHLHGMGPMLPSHKLAVLLDVV